MQGFWSFFPLNHFLNFQFLVSHCWKRAKYCQHFFPGFQGGTTLIWCPFTMKKLQTQKQLTTKSSPDVCLYMEYSTPLVSHYGSYFFGAEELWQLNGVPPAGRAAIPTRYAQSPSCYKRIYHSTSKNSCITMVLFPPSPSALDLFWPKLMKCQQVQIWRGGSRREI